jgi:hypothetical protein
VRAIVDMRIEAKNIPEDCEKSIAIRNEEISNRYARLLHLIYDPTTKLCGAGWLPMRHRHLDEVFTVCKRLYTDFLPLKIAIPIDHDAFPLNLWHGCVPYDNITLRDGLYNKDNANIIGNIKCPAKYDMRNLNMSTIPPYQEKRIRRFLVKHRKIHRMEKMIHDDNTDIDGNNIYRIYMITLFTSINRPDDYIVSGLTTVNRRLRCFTRKNTSSDEIVNPGYSFRTPSWIAVKIMSRNPYIDLPPDLLWVPRHQRMWFLPSRKCPYV